MRRFIIKSNKHLTILIASFVILVFMLGLSEGFGIKAFSRSNINTAKCAEYQLLSKGGAKLSTFGKSNGSIYKSFILNVNGKEKTFNWLGIWNKTIKPHISIINPNNSNNKKLAVFMTIGEGTGYYINKVHIVDLKSMKENFVEDPLKAIKEHVKTSINKNGYSVEIDSHKINYKYNNGYNGEKLYKNLCCSNVLECYLSQNSLVCKVGGEISNGQFVGDFYIKYKNTNGIFDCNMVYFRCISN